MNKDRPFRHQHNPYIHSSSQRVLQDDQPGTRRQTYRPIERRTRQPSIPVEFSTEKVTSSQMCEPQKGQQAKHRYTYTGGYGVKSSSASYSGRKKGPPEHCLVGEQIEELASATDAHELITLINQNEKGFLRAFQHKKFLDSNKTLKHLVRILFNLVKSGETVTASRIMSQIFAPGSEYAAFHGSVQQLFQSIYTEPNKENIEAFSQFIRIGKFCIEKIPSQAVKTVQLPLMKTYVRKALLYLDERLEEKKLLKAIKSDLEALETLFDKFDEEQPKPKPKPVKHTQAIIAVEINPPEPFTDLSILPIANELSCEAKVYLRPNIVAGPYQSWKHYTDIQFRLLREDFIRPLRNGILDFLQGEPLQGADVRVYTKVKLLKPVSLGSGLGFDVSFDPTPFKRINWSYTKRLINGSLLCFFTDKFVAIAFATVAGRKNELLQQGIVTVKFEGSVNGFQLDPATEYTMVESVAYFEAYRHVLSRLQEVVTDHEIDTMPFKQYIVDSTFNADIPLPLYARFIRDRNVVFDLHGVVRLTRPRYCSTRVNLADPSSWPDACHTDLDESQMVAMKAALTQDLSVIQGPPGTGKTFIGLKIVQGLLANRDLWDPHKKTPILVVCYTNHALDQFLEGIQQTLVNGKSPNLTRIGGRCKSVLLADCTLFEKVREVRESRSFPRNLYRDFNEARTEMMDYKRTIEGLMDEIESTKVTLLTNDILVKYISRSHFKQLIKEFGRNRPIEAWLGLRYTATQQLSSLSHEQSLNPHEESSGDSDSENEVQVILNHRLVDRRETIYRPHRKRLISSDVSKLEGKTDQDGWRTVQMDKKQRQKIIRKQLSRGLKPLSPESVYDLRDLQPQERWRLYLSWKDKHVEDLLQRIRDLSSDYELSCKEFQAKKQVNDSFVVEDSDVVGMTTTGAAKYNYIIKTIKPKIVIVEEAAEIFEPHIFTSISPSVQQLILIGDHQQLRPKPTCYELETQYNFNVSLFERLINNGCPHQSLNIQHRMRPEIASLITPSIYKVLYNHVSVERYDHVKGIGKDLYFIHHNFAEVSDDGDRKSHSNPYEAEYLTALCTYLLKQGYKEHEITMLTLYSGQVIEIKKNLKQKKITGVRTVVVDDFQGEENEIILLSLVRSNRAKNIGFLSIENRVCVALSRAKKGMFIIGNAHMLSHRADTKWPEILRKLKSIEGLGVSLPLQCQIHKEQKVEAKVAADFDDCREGGCKRPCNTRLECGHTCKRLCHPLDREHKTDYRCDEKVLKKLPKCGHYRRVSCSADVTKVKCLLPCSKILRCGHKCTNTCSSPCTEMCEHPVIKKLNCGHIVKIHCYQKPSEIVCPKACFSEEEISSATVVSKRVWMTCPIGHYYSQSRDSTGAIVKAKCPNCGL